MFAVIKTGGKQYKVQVGETIDVEKLDVEEGAQVRLDQVLLAVNDGDVAYGRPLIDGAVVTARVVRQHKGPKLIVFRYKSKSRYRRRTGHRQQLTQLAIQTIEVPGWQAATARATRASTPTAEAAPVVAPSAAQMEAPVTETVASAPEVGTPVPEAAPPAGAVTGEAAPAGPGSAAPPSDVLPAIDPRAQVAVTDTGSIGAMPGMAAEEGSPHPPGAAGEEPA